MASRNAPRGEYDLQLSNESGTFGFAFRKPADFMTPKAAGFAVCGAEKGRHVVPGALEGGTVRQSAQDG